MKLLSIIKKIEFLLCESEYLLLYELSKSFSSKSIMNIYLLYELARIASSKYNYLIV